jgi:abortive infection bacteriophage resistance protein
MQKSSYSKNPLTYIEQLDQLKKRGLIVESDKKALFILEAISYYRLSGYWYPLLEDKQKHIFKKTATFNTAFDIYCFDKDLRKLVLNELEKIEVAIRAKMIYILSHKYGPFWFQDLTIFKNPVEHSNTITNINKEFIRSDEEFIRAFKNKYIEPLPPSWIILEIASFGSLSRLYQNLSPSREKRDIAHHFGFADGVFQTWLHSIVYLRNVCAHHSRLWNRVLQITPQNPRKPHFDWINDENVAINKTYFMLCIVKYLLNVVNPRNRFKEKVIELLNKYKNISPKAIGFSDNWESEILWNSKS